MNIEMDININAVSGPVEMFTYYLSSFTNTGNENGTGTGNSNAEEEEEYSHNPSKPAVPRQKINARERYRTFNVNAAYEALRSLIPTEPVNRKLSKIEIIRLASSYITHLRSTLHAGTDRQPCLTHKWENNNKYSEVDIGIVPERVSICTFCLKPQIANATLSGH